jgi:AcrR family transcriptional regulator
MATVRLKAPADLPALPRRQARSEATRQRILHATVVSLAQRGLGATTTIQIQADAGVSRGRLLHHFPIRRDLLVAAVQHLANERFAAARLNEVSGVGPERIRSVIERLWATYSGDLFWAAMELWLGSRADEELRQALIADERHLGRVVRGMCDDLFGPKVAARPAYEEVRDLLISSMRGVAMTYSFDRRPMDTEPMIDVWCRTITSVEAGRERVDRRCRHGGDLIAGPLAG